MCAIIQQPLIFQTDFLFSGKYGTKTPVRFTYRCNEKCDIFNFIYLSGCVGHVALNCSLIVVINNYS